MRNRFDQQLEQLNEDLIELGAMCKEAIADATTALLSMVCTVSQEIIAARAEVPSWSLDMPMATPRAKRIAMLSMRMPPALMSSRAARLLAPQPAGSIQ